MDISEPQIIKIAYNLFLSLAFLHSVGVMHRDIKPANILIDADLNIKICDFGLSRMQLATDALTGIDSSPKTNPEEEKERISAWLKKTVDKRIK